MRMHGGDAYHERSCWDFATMRVSSVERAQDLPIKWRLLSSSTVEHKDIPFRIHSDVLWVINFSCTSSHLHCDNANAVWLQHNSVQRFVFLHLYLLSVLWLWLVSHLSELCFIFARLSISLFLRFDCVWNYEPWMVFYWILGNTLPYNHQCGQLPKKSAFWETPNNYFRVNV